MSDEEIKDLYNGWDKHDDRISELEKNLNEIDDCDHGALQHFEKLIRTSQKEIAELRNHQKNTDTLIREYEQAHNFQTNELKEHGHNTYYNGINLNSEVLRELIKGLGEFPIPDEDTFYLYLLEKLDGKKVCYSCKFLYEPSGEHCNKCIAGKYTEHKKDSGGEKTVEVGLGDSKDEDSSRKTVSKTSDSLTRFRDKVLEPFDSKLPELLDSEFESGKFLEGQKLISEFVEKLKKGYKDHFEVDKFEKYKYALQSLQIWFELIIEEYEEKLK